MVAAHERPGNDRAARRRRRVAAPQPPADEPALGCAARRAPRRRARGRPRRGGQGGGGGGQREGTRGRRGHQRAEGAERCARLGRRVPRRVRRGGGDPPARDRRDPRLRAGRRLRARAHAATCASAPRTRGWASPRSCSGSSRAPAGRSAWRGSSARRARRSWCGAAARCAPRRRSRSGSSTGWCPPTRWRPTRSTGRAQLGAGAVVAMGLAKRVIDDGLGCAARRRARPRGRRVRRGVRHRRRARSASSRSSSTARARRVLGTVSAAPPRATRGPGAFR